MKKRTPLSSPLSLTPIAFGALLLAAGAATAQTAAQSTDTAPRTIATVVVNA